MQEFLCVFQDCKIVDAEKYKELLDTNETLKNEITKLEKVRNETERLVSTSKIKRIHHWCSVGTGKSQPEGPPFQWETRLGISRFHCTPMIDSISHISNKE